MQHSETHDLTLTGLLGMVDPGVTPEDTKVHLATHNSIEHPLDVYFEGRFDAWQAYQTKKNFSRRYVISLIGLRERHRWLYVGTYDVLGVRSADRNQSHYIYEMSPRTQTDSLSGRTVVRFERSGRMPYLRCERWADRMYIDEIRARRMRFSDFPGFIDFELSHPQLRALIQRSPDSWRAALSSVAGVYVIADESNGKQYVGSAVGSGGIWSRWSSYAANGHGGNKELKDLLRQRGASHADRFRYAILETADTRATEEDVLARESHWKRALLTREYGYNGN